MRVRLRLPILQVVGEAGGADGREGRLERDAGLDAATAGIGNVLGRSRNDAGGKGKPVECSPNAPEH